MKIDILKKKGNILNILDLSKLNTSVNTAPRYPSPTVNSQINEMFAQNIQRHMPLKWDPVSKKWMGPD